MLKKRERHFGATSKTNQGEWVGVHKIKPSNNRGNRGFAFMLENTFFVILNPPPLTVHGKASCTTNIKTAFEQILMGQLMSPHPPTSSPP